MEDTQKSKSSNENDESSSSSYQTHKPDPALLEAYRYINEIPGKNVRGKLVDCFQLWLQVEDPDVLQKIKDIIGDLHNASLLVDDIEDNSKLRRGIPVAHSIFGIPAVINTANYVYFIALEKCHALQNPKAMEVFVGELLNLHRGQGHDIAWRDNVECPTEEEYCHMVKDKTGGLFRLAVGLMKSFATQNLDTDLTPLVDNLGLYFQIRDDFINLADEEYMKSKSFCEDLSEGKFSFPIIHCVRQSRGENGVNGGSEGQRLLHILKQRTEDVDLKRYAQSLMRDAGSLEYTRQFCKQIKDEIETQIESLGGNKPLWQLVQYLDVQLEGVAATERRNCMMQQSPRSGKAATLSDKLLEEETTDE
mmetsp:Transcript_23028/g.32238  ORF Transcript_23028/g.32238 Transcript_23028/m.32238 type:complete len:363 (+) Transcript_23028:79-1167(+)